MSWIDFSEFQVIPSIRKLNDLEIALKSDVQVILLTEAHIANLLDLVKLVHAKDKKALINLELLGGFGKDHVGMKLLKNYYHVDGVMSTDSSKLGMAKQCGLVTFQRFFLHDSRSFETTLKIIESSRVDGAELLPAVMALDCYSKLISIAKIPLLAGGFIRDREMMEKIKICGFKGLTVSEKSLW
ncbi:glycerol-3-phosphate responsive antiterminator [Acetobacterium woodii]|uniref:Glycerol-3-phosphate responsive antiterminator GlpP2 n=1 Tax=Acetobacterium woodii (strain ATCC 29683 / DSM 1030 / JCM 2381 / KCTC 1655 / WB1) TaxID=931626 RepID=H6LIH8_ACEWD|nr:glycerol-3-phosphate responsive antiterminator [Acetobacterium woodii]AFA48552.1 glycerol-3-phosphate responsive antiterminator GlpP2 [Acetobacterium woodii DSM 1030]